jgi:hypothetical protein
MKGFPRKGERITTEEKRMMLRMRRKLEVTAQHLIFFFILLSVNLELFEYTKPS